MKANDNTVAIPDRSEVIETPTSPRRYRGVRGSASVVAAGTRGAMAL